MNKLNLLIASATAIFIFSNCGKSIDNGVRSNGNDLSPQNCPQNLQMNYSLHPGDTGAPGELSVALESVARVESVSVNGTKVVFTFDEKKNTIQLLDGAFDKDSMIQAQTCLNPPSATPSVAPPSNGVPSDGTPVSDPNGKSKPVSPKPDPEQQQKPSPSPKPIEKG